MPAVGPRSDHAEKSWVQMRRPFGYDAMEDAVTMFKALADPNRLRVFWLLARIDERICVAEAMDVLAESHYNASRMLKGLLQVGLVTAKREGKWVFYSLAPAEKESVHGRLVEAVRAISADKFSQEIRRCQLRLGMRQNGECVAGLGSEGWDKVSRQMQKATAKAARTARGKRPKAGA